MIKSMENYYKVIEERDGNSVVFSIEKSVESTPNRFRLIDIEILRWRTQGDLVAWLRQCADAVEGMK